MGRHHETGRLGAEIVPLARIVPSKREALEELGALALKRESPWRALLPGTIQTLGMALLRQILRTHGIC